MPTRRTFELMIMTIILATPALGTAKLWAKKALATHNPGTITHGAGEIMVVLL